MSVLVLAGIDPSGAAGLQRDLWTLAHCRQRALAIPTCLTLQTSSPRCDAIDTDWLAATLDEVVAQTEGRGFEPQAIKIGLVAHVAVWRTLLPRLESLARRGIPIVVDPVRGPSSGGFEVEEGVREILRNEVGGLGAVLTPNLPEAQWLVGPRDHLRTDGQADNAADIEAENAMLDELLALGFRSVLLKGGHREGADVGDRFRSHDFDVHWHRQRQAGPPRRGTGCALASFLAAGLAEGLDMLMAARVAGHQLQQVWRELAIASPR